MRAQFGDPAPRASRNPGGWVKLASAMIDVGETEAARVALTASLNAVRSDPYGALELARLASESGLHDLALTAAGYVLNPLSQAERTSAPLALLRLAYPAPFPQAVQSAAATEGVPPLLLLALTRQESIFNPRARSKAGALGLTQVMPETGESIAASLTTEWRPESLAEPTVSLRFGAHYLGQQLRRYHGNMLAALAAYNAGPGSADRWMHKSGGDVDGFLEAVEYDETQLYIERVLENYALYRFVYGFASRPSIG